MVDKLTKELTGDDRTEILERLVRHLQKTYVFPETAAKLSRRLKQGLDKGDFDLLSDPHQFAQAVTAEMFAVSQDPHLHLRYDPEQAVPAGDKGFDGEELLKRHFQKARRANLGFATAARLAGNIGYLDLRELPPVDVAGEIATGAMALLAHTQALIFDLRFNQGGSAGMVQFLSSYLFDETPRQLSSIYSRPRDTVERFWTLTEIPGRRLPDLEVYVLVSGMTYSAAEAFAYDLQALKRATIVGEKSRGGAHLVDYQLLADGCLLTLPTARAINPITGANWEGVGVIPDIEVPQDQALPVAHRRALAGLLQKAAEESERRFLLWEMESLEVALKPVTVDEDLLQLYVGRYDDWDITFEGGSLFAHRHTRLRLRPLTEDTFSFTDEIRLKFVAVEPGSVKEMIVLEREGTSTPHQRAQLSGKTA